jgi:hypothetical protein
MHTMLHTAATAVHCQEPFLAANSNPHLLWPTLIPAACPPFQAPYFDAVVKVHCVHTEPNYSLPWQRKRQFTSTSSGFIVAGPKPADRWLLTNAHSVDYHTQVYLCAFIQTVSLLQQQAMRTARVHEFYCMFVQLASCGTCELIDHSTHDAVLAFPLSA